ncbi:NAD-binding lipoprotein [Streptomyces lunaelactis]|uniref:NAD-binding lipoprotein n=1 Tax=Streptomyces lunaelactis TaxID=1535768 RepID=A0A2R4T9F0_9ACTN|nr:NAD-binding lipoprotein [Streptomyces lunaelactis]AVZ75756.1 NAD-binding lipoprotein [Streptomyces lunaelactis]NUK84630.1 NAD-binding lipoprotein [Streptomyces lunaelactis]
MAQQHTTSLRLRLRYRFDHLVSGGTTALIGWLALACLAVVVPASMVLVWSDRAAPATLSGRLTAVWASVGQTLKIGGAVGSPLYVLASVSLALVALLFVSTLVSLITTGINRRIMSLRLGHSTVLETRHTVVLGWSDQVFPVIGELVAANANQRRSAIAVLAPQDKVWMEDEISTRVSDSGRTRIICRNGSTTDPAELCRVSPRTAKAVLVLPPTGDTGDAHVVKTLLALDAAAPGSGEGEAVVVAAVRDSRNHRTARLAAGPTGHVLCVDDIVARLLVSTARQPGLSLIYSELLDFEGDEFYPVAAEGLVGRTFGEALLSFATSSAVGLLHTDGSVTLNPDPRAAIGPADRIIVISQDDDTGVRADVASHVEEDAIVTAGPRIAQAERLLLLGWNRRAPLVIEQLGQYVSPGTTLDVVALGEYAATRGTRAVTAERSRLEVSFHDGDITDPLTLAKLDVPSYDSLIVIGETEPAASASASVSACGSASDTPVAPLAPVTDPDARADDRTLVTLLHLRAIGDAAQRELALTTEMSDDGNRLLAPARGGADFIVSGRLISLLMTQISESPYLAEVFEELFKAEGHEFHLKPAADYVRAGHEVSFATAVESARRRRECAVGYRLRARSATGPDYGVRINPDKRRRVRFSEEDWLIVLAES